MYSAGGSGERKHAHTNISGALVFSLSITAKEFSIEHMPQSIELSKMLTQIKRLTNAIDKKRLLIAKNKSS